MKNRRPSGGGDQKRERKPLMFRSAMLLLAVGVLAGCATRSALPPMSEDGALEARRWQVEIAAHDGTPLALTVWQPSLAEGQDAPLMLHTHGIGLSRMKRSVGLYANVLFTGRTARQLWKDGYWLITWDQRGHGGSGDLIHMLDPKREVRDVSTIIDWAEQNLTRLARRDGDPRIGMIGESYGGAVQYLASASDPRIDAIVPVATWYDLDMALAPADIPKGGWLRVLYLITDWWNWRQLPAVLREGFAGARDGQVPAPAREFLAGHELQAFCERGEYPGADALMIQGLRDVLFNPAHALAAAGCFERAGQDARLVVTRDGHLLPFHQDSGQVPGWDLDERLHCFDEPRDTDAVVTAWLDERLRDGPAARVPRVCVSPHDWGLALDAWPTATTSIPLASVTLSGDGSRQRGTLSTPSRWFTLLRGDEAVDDGFDAPVDGRRHPAFIPLHTAERTEVRIGTPRLRLQADSDQPVFVALVKRRPGRAGLVRIHEQEKPVRPGEEVTLPPVAIRLEPGEQLGLTLYSRSRQFSGSRPDLGRGVEYSGRLLLPRPLGGEAPALVKGED